MNFIPGSGLFHVLLLALCGWAVSSDAIQVLSISFILPAAACELDLDDADDGLLTSVVFAGKGSLAQWTHDVKNNNMTSKRRHNVVLAS